MPMDLSVLDELVARLRSPDGCPWDREQTHHSLVSHLIEEAYETVEALSRLAPAAPAGELSIPYR